MLDRHPNQQATNIIRLLLLTGARKGEVLAARWDDINLDAGIWTKPGSTSKQKSTHVVPLSAAARAIVDARPRRTGRDFIFGREQDRPLTGWSVCKAALDARLGAAVAHWTHHDLRRTAATKMAEIGIAPHIVEAILNHVSGHKHGVSGVYNRAAYEAQKRHALTAWADHLLAIVEGWATAATVVPLRA